MIQTFFNTDGTGLTAIITVIVDGAHVDPDSWPITDDPGIVLSSHPSASKTVTAIDTGVFKAVWSSLSPALAHGDVVFISVDGEISAAAWTTWQIPVQVIWLPATPANVTTSTSTITALLPAALVSGRMDASVGAMANDTLTAAAISADAGAELAALVETYIVNEGDATATMQAIADRIAADWVAGDASPLAVSTAVWSAATRSLTDKTGFALSATGLDLVTTWTTDITGSLSGNVGGIAGTINTLDELDTAQDTQHGTTRTAVDDAFTVIKGATWSGTTDTLEAIRDRGDVAWITGAGGGGSTTISTADINNIVAGVTRSKSRIVSASANSYTMIIGDTWIQQLSAVAATEHVLSIKSAVTDSDDAAVLLVSSLDGLTRLNGLAYPTSSDGSITYASSVDTVTIESNVTLLIPAGTYVMTLKGLSDGADLTWENAAEITISVGGVAEITS